MRDIRTAKGLTQQQLADLIRKPRTQVANWERGRAMSVENRALVAKALDVPPTALGKAWDPEAPRTRRSASVRDGHKVRYNPDTPAPTQGDDVSELPDSALFDRLAGLWRAMPPSARHALYNSALRSIPPVPIEESEGKGEGRRSRP